MVKRVDANPGLKSKAGPYYYTWAAVSGFYRRYLCNPVRLRVEVDGREVEGITAIAQNSDPFTYFASRPIRVCEGIAIDDGKLAVGVLKRASPARHADPDLPPPQRPQDARRHRQIDFDDSPRGDGLLDRRPTPTAAAALPGPGRRRLHRRRTTRVEIGVLPGALTVVA